MGAEEWSLLLAVTGQLPPGIQNAYGHGSPESWRRGLSPGPGNDRLQGHRPTRVTWERASRGQAAQSEE